MISDEASTVVGNASTVFVDAIVVLLVTPRYGPQAGGTNLTVTLICPRSGCGDLNLNIGEIQCVKLHYVMYV